MFPARLYSQKEISNACKHMEIIFGTDFFKKGIEHIKDTDAVGSGMGREYSAQGASKLLLAWHKATEELVYADIQGFFRPGPHSAAIGALSEDILRLEDIPGIEGITAGLASDIAFDRAAFTLSVASGFRKLTEKIAFSGEPGSFILTEKEYRVSCFSTETFSRTYGQFTRQKKALAETFIDIQEEVIKKGEAFTVKYIFYFDITVLPDTLDSGWKYLLDSSSFLRPKTAAIVICKTAYPAMAQGVSRKIYGWAAINKETPGQNQAGGPLLFLPE